MKLLLVATALAFAASAGAQTVGKQAGTEALRAQQAAARKALPQPAPYGAYFLETFMQDGAENRAAQDAIAKHYGYKDESDAYRACLRARTEPNCSGDIVAHRRAESPELAKYGFKTWKEAVSACAKNNREDKEFAPKFGLMYCTADPFLKLRGNK
jgi:hypothetical protein